MESGAMGESVAHDFDAKDLARNSHRRLCQRWRFDIGEAPVGPEAVDRPSQVARPLITFSLLASG